ncbi:MAG: exodeoxyribonuclease VII small subunit [Lachnospiraceae bacterium]|nr:exodeoxyribonuclease VII small subunit [Lachnospiraceae bacterium]
MPNIDNEINNNMLPLEQALGRLEEIIGRLEDRDIPLEESFNLYKQGVELVRYCEQSVSQVEQQLIVLQKGQEDGL